jgi:triosephosphate isomerase
VLGKILFNQEGLMRIPMVAANWKMNLVVSEAINLVKEIQPELNSILNLENILCPPFISLVAIHELVKGTNTKLGAQNLYFEEKGAYTGEISPLMLAGYCEFVIIGHSERRQYFNETNDIVRKKVDSAMKHNLKPILCVGENLSEFEAGKTQEVVKRQIVACLEGITKTEPLTIAYEPIWAIGTGKAATGIEANKTIGFIRKIIENKYNIVFSQNIRILYGGSVTSANIAEFVSQPEIDGALVGGASLKPKEFISIVQQTSSIRK